jgi:hypothetical protein
MDQISFGLHSTQEQRKIEANLSIYYRETQNQIRFSGFSDVLFSNQLETEVIRGDGYSIGLETYLKKEIPGWSGWVSYTLSDSRSRFAALNNGNFFPSDFDRRHDFSINLIKRFDAVSLNASWTYATGSPYTVPTGTYIYQDVLYPTFTEVNNFRLPDLHHLDASVTFQGRGRNKSFSSSSFVFSIYNLYGRKNAYSYVFRTDPETGELNTFKLYLFTIVPSFTYNFKF